MRAADFLEPVRTFGLWEIVVERVTSRISEASELSILSFGQQLCWFRMCHNGHKAII